MKAVQIDTEILNQIARLSKAIVEFDYSKRIAIDFNHDVINEIAGNLNLLADNLMLNPPDVKGSERIDISHFISVISSFATHDFSQKLPVSKDGTILLSLIHI